MIAIFYTIIIFLASFILIRRLGNAVFKPGLESLMVAIPVGIAGSSLIISAVNIFFPFQISVHIAMVFMVLGAALSWYFTRTDEIVFWKNYKGLSIKTIWSGVVLTFLAGFLIFLTLNTLRPQQDGSVLIPRQASVDVVYHLSQITKIGFSHDWHFEEPNFSGEFIRYPYLINLFSGFLLAFHLPLAVAFHLPVLLLCVAVVVSIWRVSREFEVGKLISIGIIVLVFFGAGIGYAFGANFNTGTIGVTYPQQYVDFTGFVAGFFTVQRAFVLGFPLLLFAVLSFARGLKYNLAGSDSESLTAFKWSGVLLGLLPLAHSHSFLVGVIIFGGALVYYLVRRNAVAFDIIRGTVFYSVFVGIIPIFFMFLAPQFNFGGVPLLRLGWMSNPLQVGGLNLPTPDAARLMPWLKFLVTNFGVLLLLPISVIGVTAILWMRQRAQNLSNYYPLIFISIILLWLVPNVIQFQTWDYDTNKFFVYAILFSALGFALLLKTLGRKLRILGYAVFVLVMLVSAPIPILKLRYVIAIQNHQTVVEFNVAEQAAAGWIKQNTSEDAVLLSSAANASGGSLLNGTVIRSGRTATVGYITWLYTHGIDYETRLQSVQKFFETGDVRELRDEPADYLIVDSLLRGQYPNLETKLQESVGQPVYNAEKIAIYKIK